MGWGSHLRVTGVSLRVALISWKSKATLLISRKSNKQKVEGAEGEWSLFRKDSSADPPPVQQCKGERQAVSGQELTLGATSGFLGGTAGHVGQAEQP